MTRMIYPAWIVIALLFLFGNAQGQGFNYTAATSSDPYQPLTGATALGSNTNWSSTRFKIPVGFTFSFAGASFDSLTIEPNGFVKFDQQRSVVLYQGAGCKADSNNVYSSLSYTTTGTAGNKILKIQYTNCGYDKADPAEHLSYQLWLYQQNGAVEIHTGPSSYPGIEDSTYTGPTPLVGLINPLQDWSNAALLLSGNAASPVSQIITQGNDLMYLEFVPPADKIYSFTPAN